MDNQPMIRKLAWAASLGAMLALSSCNAPGTTPTGASANPPTPASPETPVQPGPPEPTAQASRVVMPPPDSAPEAGPSAPTSAPISGPEGKPGLPPASLGVDAGRSCRNDSDCAMKDAGSCCGYRPVCVNKDTPTFPEKVKAACAQDGRVGICGFPAIEGCQCVAGKCAGVLMMENSVPLQ